MIIQKSWVVFAVCVALLFADISMVHLHAAEQTEQSVSQDIQSSSPNITVQKQAGKVSGATDVLNATSAVSSREKVFSALQTAWDDLSAEGNTNTVTDRSTQNTNNGVSSTKYIGQMLMSLSLVILMALSLAWGFKRFVLKNRTLGGGHINLLASYALSQKSKVHLLQVGEECFLVGEGNNALSLISKVNLLNEVETHNQNDYDLESYEEESALKDDSFTSFEDRLSGWQQSLNEQNLSQEMKTSLLLLGGLSERLRRKGGESNG